ncbi:MAG: hypothetical protein JWQ38_2866 [Flavipsychrobacter sp.]|nr:hypothetical protein [Flavipsychrobacter sp.]
MRLRKTQNGLTITAVVGTSAVLFSLDMDEKDTQGLLGFYIRKKNAEEKQGYDFKSTKYFSELVEQPEEHAQYSTKEHPWQSFLWEDFSITDKSEYTYSFTPVYGTPGKPEYGKKASMTITIPSRSEGEHEVHFNRGVAGSQAYARKFNNERPDKMTKAKSKEALKWLSKGLKEAMLDFIGKAKNENYQLRCCFYEFIFPEVLEALKKAHDNGADVKIIYDSRKEKKKNEDAIIAAGIPKKAMMIARASDPTFLQHNKYMVLLKDKKPVAVWTGSTNITEKAIYGHCNVGHIIRNADVAKNYLKHWNCLKKDPVNADTRTGCLAIQTDIDDVSEGVTTFFSPRAKTKALNLYTNLMKGSSQLVCGMFPFGFYKGLKAEITADTDHLKYIIIDEKTKNTTLESNDYDNVIVYAGVFDIPLYHWAGEINPGDIFYHGVDFIHNNVILIDPLSDMPVVITGSANFSENSILRNDENTMVIKGNKHVADLYFTEFSRIFNHYSTRQDIKKFTKANKKSGHDPSHLYTDSKVWVPSFYKGTALKFKRKKMFSEMAADKG